MMDSQLLTNPIDVFARMKTRKKTVFIRKSFDLPHCKLTVVVEDNPIVVVRDDQDNSVV